MSTSEPPDTLPGMPVATPDAEIPAAPASETVIDSDSDIPDDQLSAALALARPATGNSSEEPMLTPTSPAGDVPGVLPIMDPRAAGGLRLAALLAREPGAAWEDKVRHLRDSFQLSPCLALALALMEPKTLSYIYDGRAFFKAHHCPSHGAGKWYALVDMIDSLSGEIALAMMRSEKLKDIALSLATL